jgi:pimeloyl-ACP methyl ester carboxylesterase
MSPDPSDGSGDASSELVVAATGRPCPGGTGDGDAPAAIAASRTDHRAPSYQPCGNGAECAAIEVPLDWAHPDRAQITLAFAVHHAADPARRIGTLVFVNGTGVSSEQFVADRMGRGAFPAELINRFDIVGVDPRGGGAHPNNTPLPLPVRSAALHCDQPPHQPRSRYFPHTAEQYRTLADYNRSFANDCLAHTGPLAAHLDPQSQARDIEAVRQALDAPTISLYGWTSGNQVVLDYLDRYPQHVRATALDQPDDPDTPQGAALIRNAAAVQDEFNRFAGWCHATTSCALHGTDVAALYDRLVAGANRQPIPTNLGFAMTGDEIRMDTDEILQLGDLVLQGSGPDALTGFGALAVAIQQAQHAVETGSGGLPYFEIEWVNSIGWHGSAEQYRVTTCDGRPTGSAPYDRLADWTRDVARAAPQLGGASPAWEAVTGCVGWTFPAAAPSGPLRFGRHTPPTLIIGSLHSAYTSYEQQQQLHSRIPGSGLLTYAGDTHVNYLSSTCIRSALQDFLITRDLPATGTTCQHAGPPAT